MKLYYNRVRIERAKQGKSITELAEMSNLSQKTISRIENGQVVPRPQTMGKIAQALGRAMNSSLNRPI